MARHRVSYFTIFIKSKNSICMKKTSILKTMLLASLCVAGAALYESASAQSSTLGNTADNCNFTGNNSDFCNGSDGTHNLKILQCAPGATSCQYDPPTGPVKNPNG